MKGEFLLTFVICLCTREKILRAHTNRIVIPNRLERKYLLMGREVAEADLFLRMSILWTSNNVGRDAGGVDSSRATESFITSVNNTGGKLCYIFFLRCRDGGCSNFKDKGG